MIAWRNSESHLCNHNFIWDGQEKAALSTLEMGSLFLWGRTDGPPGCQGIFYSWLLFFLHPFNIDCDKSASKLQPFTVLYPAQGLKDLLEDNGLNQIPRSRPNMWVTYFVVLPRHSRPVGWVQLKFGYFSGKARGIKAHYEEVKQIQEEQDALAMGGPEMDHELSMVRSRECQHQSITSLCRCLWVREVKAPRQTCEALKLISPY